MVTAAQIQKVRNLLAEVGAKIVSDNTIETAYEIAQRFVDREATASDADALEDAYMMLTRVFCYESFIEITHREIGHYPEGSKNIIKEIKATANMFLRAVGINDAFETKARELKMPPIVSMTPSKAASDAIEV